MFILFGFLALLFLSGLFLLDEKLNPPPPNYKRKYTKP